ncbi:hypothetical protein [Vallitalea okinawensis]|uniref:hypothetical protein n=1 Tax=Vallitalea okinawensis TaxID=2078660 RepID=UPI001478F3E9|nr:hypothetical protein [Vallitalea okinawensis]
MKKLVALGLLCTTVTAASFSVSANEVESDTTTVPMMERGFKGGNQAGVRGGMGKGMQNGSFKGQQGGVTLTEEQEAELLEIHAKAYAEAAGVTVDEAKALVEDFRGFRELVAEDDLREEFGTAIATYLEEAGIDFGFKGGMQGSRGGVALTEDQEAELLEIHAKAYAEVTGVSVDEAQALVEDFRDFRDLIEENDLVDEFRTAMVEYLEEAGIEYGFKGGMQGPRGGVALTEEQEAELYEAHAEAYAEVAGISVDEAKTLVEDFKDFRDLVVENDLVDEFRTAMADKMEEMDIEFGPRGGMQGSQGGMKGNRGGKGILQ